ncbi:MAG: fibrobacter succinogenes major paralogous domain-containing protein [Alistipes sp.]|nr:fibrobacter succinogenes major paralogous domain-containing protein [Alistipes sp.]
MKKILFYLLAAGAVFGVGCSKDAGVDVPVAEGKYTLSEISAELDDAETRTGLGTANVVNWSNKDRILVVNRTSGDYQQYVLVSGAGTPIGTFRPVENAITYNASDDVCAVYPAVAASVNNGKVSVSINQNYLETHDQAWLDTYGITSYSTDSQFTFTHNDIKVSYKINDLASDDAEARPNFKFKQLGVWCNFVFDFTANTDLRRDKMISFAVEAPNAISGTAEIDFTDPMAPVLKEGTENKVEWEFATVSSMGAVFTRSFMIFPNVTAKDQLTITAKTDGHNVALWNTPSKDFVAGTVLRFPINIDKDFYPGNEKDDLAYIAEEIDENPFYYYGSANCFLVTNTSLTFDVTPHKANRFYEQQNNYTSMMAPEAKTAKLIWREESISLSVTPNVNTDKRTVSVSSINGYGNAVVGIYDNNGKLLWSFHIWKPLDNPTTDMPVYTVTNSGSYTVMTMALGAVKKSVYNSTDTEKLQSYGLYYQWGRKDPLGRPVSLTASGNGYVKIYDSAGADQGNGYWVTAANVKELSDNSGAILDGVDTDVDGFELDRYMIDYAVANPTVFIKVPNGTYNNDWAGVTNNNLWANPEGYNYPEQSQLPGRSVFDPCPANYHVAPKDLWINFSKTRANTTVADEFNTRNPGNSIASIVSPYTAAMRGYSFYYQDWKTGPEDFYPASGYRYFQSGALNVVGTYGYSWSSSPYAAGNAGAGGLGFYSASVYPLNSSNRADGFSVRCVQNK